MKHKQTTRQTEETRSMTEDVINIQLDPEDIEGDGYLPPNVRKMQTGFGDFRENIKKGHKK
ncbi:hypothetical protein [Methylomonas methanica]|uniref:Uncharacterized protein n=1 Tax=Methylomonas methanica TaxID=421 RepID=A0A177LRN8_METMH|nr:hypothetical protein [Methylomonas methanica]OAH96165.1 hypothetical protein A1332_23200 [Methylomonas methanica]